MAARDGMDGRDPTLSTAQPARARAGVALLFAHLAVVAGALGALLLLGTPAPRGPFAPCGGPAAGPFSVAPAAPAPAPTRTLAADDQGGPGQGSGHHPRKRGLELDRGPVARAPLTATAPPPGAPDLADPLVARPCVDDEVPRPRIARAPPRG